MDNVRILHELGYAVDVVTNFENTSGWPLEKSMALKRELESSGSKCLQVPFSRNPLAIDSHRRSLRELTRLLQSENYDFVHTHSPIASAIVRIAARKADVPVMYTAHGFHFFDGAPLRNWVLYYPIERFLSRWTSMLITINWEDYRRAKTHFHAAAVKHIPSVGFDYDKFAHHSSNIEENRERLGIEPHDFVLLSVGDLSACKNHQIVIEALRSLKNRGELGRIKYLVAGEGTLHSNLERAVREGGLEDNVKLLGARDDVPDLYALADCYVHPSVREGFGIAPVEAMASGLPLIASRIHGMKDYIEDGKTGIAINPRSVEELCQAIVRMSLDERFRILCGSYNVKASEKYDLKNASCEMRSHYIEFIGRLPSKADYSKGAE